MAKLGYIDGAVALTGYLPVAAALMLSGIGLFVLSRTRRGTVNYLFAAGLLSLAMGDATRFVFSQSSNVTSLLLWQRIILATDITMLAAWYLFSVGFGSSDLRQGLRRHRAAAIGIGAVSLLFLALVPTNLLIAFVLVAHDGSVSFPLGWVGQAQVLASLAISMIILSNLEMTFRQAGAETRWQIKFLVLGLFAVLGFHVFWLSRTLLHGTVLPGAIDARAVIHLAAAGLIFFALLRHRLLDVDVFVSRYVIYRSLTLAVVGAYLLLLGLAQEVVYVLGLRPGAWAPAGILTVGGLLLATLLLSERVRRRLKIFIDTHFYRNKYDYRKEWLSLTERLAHAVTVEEAAPRIVEGLRETMWVRKAGIYLLEPGGTQFRLASGEDFGRAEHVLDANPAFIRWLSQHSEPFDIDRVSSMPVERESRDMVDALGRRELRIVAPMVVRNEILGLLVVGPELSGQPFRPDDYDLCRAVAAQAATAIMNARMGEDLARGREMRAFAEMSSFVIHDIKNCMNMLSLLASNTEIHMHDPAFQRDAIRTIRRSVQKMQMLLRRLSAVKPPALHRELLDLNDLVRDSLQALAGAVPGTVHVEVQAGPVPPLLADADQLQGVIQNLALNAIEALGDGGEVRIQTFHDGGDAVMVVSDNGCGMSPEFVRRSLFRPFRSTKGGFGIGLYQSKQVAEAHGGRLEVESVEGRGTSVVLRLPVNGKAGICPAGVDAIPAGHPRM